jgi:hypothetical protein
MLRSLYGMDRFTAVHPTRRCSQESGILSVRIRRENCVFLAIVLSNTIVYHDRLRTNMRKAETKAGFSRRRAIAQFEPTLRCETVLF